MAAWACWGSQPGSSYRISLLLSGKVPGEAKMPSRIEGGPRRQGVGSSTCTRLCKHMSPDLCPSLIPGCSSFHKNTAKTLLASASEDPSLLSFPCHFYNLELPLL